jgi:hypothetical protein
MAAADWTDGRPYGEDELVGGTLQVRLIRGIRAKLKPKRRPQVGTRAEGLARPGCRSLHHLANR